MLHQGCSLPITRIIALNAFSHSNSHARGEKGIFAKAFLCAPPARVASQVGIRCKDYQTLAWSETALIIVSGFFSHLLAYPSDTLWRPCFAQSISLRKRSGETFTRIFGAIEALHHLFLFGSGILNSITHLNRVQGKTVKSFSCSHIGYSQARNTKIA